VSRRSLTALLALVVVSLIAITAVVRDRQGDEPTAIVERQEGPFRAGPLPMASTASPRPASGSRTRAAGYSTAARCAAAPTS
jgi:hypothetical protein